MVGYEWYRKNSQFVWKKKVKKKIKKEIMEAITGMHNVPCKNISWQCRL